jgi:aminoglycoside phosphotransferase (APT) family kinase protein
MAMIDVEQLVPAAPLSAWLDLHLGAGRGAPVTVTKIGQGRSNLTFRVTRGDQRWVLRRPPLGDLPETAHDMLREHRVLTALADTAVRSPRPLAACAEPGVIGAPFYLMEVVDGIVIRERVPERFPKAERGGIGREMVAALAELHRTDHVAVGLGGLGRPDGYTARQVARWARQWELGATRALPDVEAVHAWLAAHVPSDSPHAIVHGDYKLDNVVFAAEPPARLAGILDWEMATLGDPLADLGYLLVFWPERGEDNLVMLPQPTVQPGFATRAELIDRYEAASGLVVTDLSFYRTLALWKLAILSEGLYKRHLAGQADSDWFAVLERAVPAMARQARTWCDA